MNLAAVLLILVAEAFVLLGIVLLLRLRNRIASRVAPGASRVAPGTFARRARIIARRARERNNLPVDETFVARSGAGTRQDRNG